MYQLIISFLHRNLLILVDYVWLIISPPFCIYCHIFIYNNKLFCAECMATIKPVVSSIIPLTKNKSLKVYAITSYQEPLKSLILAKNRSHIVASHQLGRLMWELTGLKNIPCDFLIPIPLHWTRFAWRGYDQAHEIAKAISLTSGLVVTCILQRNKQTLFQAELTKEQRKHNLADALTLHPAIACGLYNNKHLVIIDDLLTSGVTLKMAAKALLPLKPASITAIVACRVI